jgi:hypothetical protein
MLLRKASIERDSGDFLAMEASLARVLPAGVLVEMLVEVTRAIPTLAKPQP